MRKTKTKNRKSKKFIYLSLTALALVGVLFGGVFAYYNFGGEMLGKLSFYLDLANPSVKVVRIQEGLRKEQVVELVGEKLGWSDTEKEAFLNAHLALNTENMEGKYFPKTYLIHKDAEPIEVTETMLEEFEKKVEKIEKTAKNSLINQDTAVTIASIIQREAAGKEDMALISGIIWNRIWAGMKLQMDATLQYAKGTEEEGWWPRVVPEDKKIESDYNTYLNEGLPPGAIANPGADAISAAYNPQKTKCLFYVHDKKRKIHCAETYEEHKENIEKYYK